MLTKILNKRVTIKAMIIGMVLANLAHVYLDSHYPPIF